MWNKLVVLVGLVLVPSHMPKETTKRQDKPTPVERTDKPVAK